MTPDPSVLLKSIDAIVAKPLEADTRIMFRISLMRYNLQVDLRPTAASVDNVFKGLLTEFEQIAYLQEGDITTSTATRSTVRAKSLDVAPSSSRPSSPTSPTSTAGCKFYLADQGCRRGNKCKFPHNWKEIPRSQRKGKCLVCGSTAHRAKDCKAPGGGPTTPPPSAATSLPKEEEARPQGKSVTFEVPGQTALAGPQPAASTSSSSTSGYEMKQLMTEALEELRRMKALDITGERLRSMVPWMSRKGLLDSGATHPLRPASPQELATAGKVKVTLAGDAQQEMSQSDQGTILVGDTSQVIVPMGRVIQQLGYSVKWTPDSCVLVSAEGEELKLTVTKGCPELDEDQALKLITKLEETQLQELRSRTTFTERVVKVAKMSWWTALKDYVETGHPVMGRTALDKSPFLMGIGAEEKALWLGEGDCESLWESLRKLPANRRMRKRLYRSSTWVVRWDPEELERKCDMVGCLEGRYDAVLFNVNWLISCGGHPDDVWKVMVLGARLGKISAIVAREGPMSSRRYKYQAKVHLLHSVSVLGRARNLGSWTGGSWTPGFFVESSPADLPQGTRWRDSKEYQEYEEEMGISPPFVTADDLVKVVGIWCGLLGTGKRPKMFKVTSEDAWRRHILNNHQPFRRDCALCLRNGGVGRQHRATPNPRAYVLSVDVAGPLRRKGRSADGKGFRYFLLGAYRYPKQDLEMERGHPLPETIPPNCEDPPLPPPPDQPEEGDEEEL